MIKMHNFIAFRSKEREFFVVSDILRGYSHMPKGSGGGGEVILGEKPHWDEETRVAWPLGCLRAQLGPNLLTPSFSSVCNQSTMRITIIILLCTSVLSMYKQSDT